MYRIYLFINVFRKKSFIYEHNYREKRNYIFINIIREEKEQSHILMSFYMSKSMNSPTRATHEKKRGSNYIFQLVSLGNEFAKHEQ